MTASINSVSGFLLNTSLGQIISPHISLLNQTKIRLWASKQQCTIDWIIVPKLLKWWKLSPPARWCCLSPSSLPNINQNLNCLGQNSTRFFPKLPVIAGTHQGHTFYSRSSDCLVITIKSVLLKPAKCSEFRQRLAKTHEGAELVQIRSQIWTKDA
mgnify:CR=1 FL=1